MTDLFISYKREERAAAEKIAYILEGHGFSVWWDAELLPGERYREAIEKFIRAAKGTIVLWSREAVKSQFLVDEAGYGREVNTLIPIALEEVDLPLGFRELHAHPIRPEEMSPGAASVEPLLRSVESVVGRARSAFSEEKAKAGVGTSKIVPDRSYELAFQRWLSDFVGTFVSVAGLFLVFFAFYLLAEGISPSDIDFRFVVEHLLKMIHIYTGMILLGGGIIIIIVFRASTTYPSLEGRSACANTARRLTLYAWFPAAIFQPLFGWGVEEFKLGDPLATDGSGEAKKLWWYLVWTLYTAALLSWLKGLLRAGAIATENTRSHSAAVQRSLEFSRDVYFWVGILLIAAVFQLMVYRADFHAIVDHILSSAE